MTGPERWEVLWDHAMRALDSLTGFVSVTWAFGGGTAMRLAYAHRESDDIDIFLIDASALNGLSPRLNDTVESITSLYTEQSNFLKLRLPQGEIDFILAPKLLVTVPYAAMRIRNHEADVESPLEIVAKKCFYRAADFTVRDVFDLAVVLERDRVGVTAHRDVFLAKREVLLARLRRLSATATLPRGFETQIEALAVMPAFDHLKRSALADALAFVEEGR